MSEEYGRCKCGGLGFQYSNALPDNHVVCSKCHMVWELEQGMLKQSQFQFTDERMKTIVDCMQEIVYAFRPEQKQTSIIDTILDELP